MKKIIAFMIAMAFALTFTACIGDKTSDSTATPSTQIPQESKPTAQESKPTPQESKPTAQESKPTPQESKPTAQESKPTAQESKPTTQESKPTTQLPQTSIETSEANSRQDFILKLTETDIAAAKKVAEQYFEGMPNQEEVLGVISIDFDSEMQKYPWEEYGEGLGGDPDQPHYSPGNLVIFSVPTKRYGDADSIVLGRKKANSEWEVIGYGR